MRVKRKRKKELAVGMGFENDGVELSMVGSVC